MKKYRFLFIGFIILLGIVIYSCTKYYFDNFSYNNYYNIKKYCYENKDYDNSYCNAFKINDVVNESYLASYIENYNPKKLKLKADAITVTSEIVELSFFKNLQIFSPLLIIFVIIGSLQNEFSSGNFKNYLLRENYLKYLKEKYKIVPLTALLIPISLIIIFLFSCIITKFNFDTTGVNQNLAVYDEWKYNHFLVYGVCICVIQFLISLLYANIGIFCIRKNKNKIVSIIMGFLYFILTYIFIYIFIYVVIINKILGFKELTDYFNISGYWFFSKDVNIFLVVLLSFIFQFLSLEFIYIKYMNKEKLVLAYEKQAS